MPERGATPPPGLGHMVDLVPLAPAALAVGRGELRCGVANGPGTYLRAPEPQPPRRTRSPCRRIRGCYRNGQHEEQVGHSPHCLPAQHPAVRGKDRRGRRGRGCHKMLPLTPKPDRREPGEGDENEIAPERDLLTVRDEGRTTRSSRAVAAARAPAARCSMSIGLRGPVALATPVNSAASVRESGDLFDTDRLNKCAQLRPRPKTHSS